mmetsp:Transcript_10324/g.35102  ORF Transcript_10324/g.35102 Transcript_10324/m.35102 type:complete len:105 (+) Transcript_10324:85-399(+)
MAPADFGEKNPPKSNDLYATAKFIGDRCFDENLAFFKCKDAHGHPARCLDQGQAVRKCAFAVMNDVQKKAPKELKAYSDCLHDNGLKLDRCRHVQKAFEEAVFT